MLFASKAATAAAKPGDGPDQWLAKYTSNLAELGFAVTGSALVNHTFDKVGVQVHKAIIPFLTIAFGGAAIGPVILAGLQNLKEMDANSPWITLFDRETRRFDVSEMHFAAISSDDTSTTIKYAIARLKVKRSTTSVLFLKVTEAEAQFKSSTTSMTTNNALMAEIEPVMRARLGAASRSFIADTPLSLT
jgi:hypothetical protein